MIVTLDHIIVRSLIRMPASVTMSNITYSLRDIIMLSRVDVSENVAHILTFPHCRMCTGKPTENVKIIDDLVLPVNMVCPKCLVAYVKHCNKHGYRFPEVAGKQADSVGDWNVVAAGYQWNSVELIVNGKIKGHSNQLRYLRRYKEVLAQVADPYHFGVQWDMDMNALYARTDTLDWHDLFTFDWYALLGMANERMTEERRLYG